MESTVYVTMRTQRISGPDGNFNDLSARVKYRAPMISYRTAQALGTYARLTAPQPPRQAWWYGTVNPKTKRAVPAWEQYVRSGHLRSSITRPIKVGVGQYDVLVLASYARFVEHGTRYMPAQPFWRNSVNYVRNEVMKPMVESWLKKDMPGGLDSMGFGPFPKAETPMVSTGSFGPFPKGGSETEPIKRFGPFPKAGTPIDPSEFEVLK